jgi:hypothetical protein
MRFDKALGEISRDIQGGTFISIEEYQDAASLERTSDAG